MTYSPAFKKAFELSEEGERREVRTSTLRSITAQSLNSYRRQLQRFFNWMKEEKITEFEMGSKEEREACEDYAHNYVHGENLRGSTLVKFSSAIQLMHSLEGVETSWTKQGSWTKYLKGLERESKDPTWRFPWTESMITEMINISVELDDITMACGLIILFYGLARSGHLPNIMFQDVFPYEGVNPFYAGTKRFFEIWIVGIKGRKRKFEGGFIKVPDIDDLVSQLLSKHDTKKHEHPFLIGWNEQRALQFVRFYAEAKGIARLGYRFDLHSFRCGGSAFYVSRGVLASLIKAQAKWTEESKMLEHYSASLPPSLLNYINSDDFKELVVSLKGLRLQNKSKLTSMMDTRFYKERLAFLYPKESLDQMFEAERTLDYTGEPLLEDSDVSDDDDIQTQPISAGKKICHVCEKSGIYAPITCRVCDKEVHAMCSTYGRCKKCKGMEGEIVSKKEAKIDSERSVVKETDCEEPPTRMSKLHANACAFFTKKEKPQTSISPTTTGNTMTNPKCESPSWREETDNSGGTRKYISLFFSKRKT